jgi:cold shock CspA family protein
MFVSQAMTGLQETGQSGLTTGRIDYVNSTDGCGFITTETTERDVLFLRNAAMEFAPEVGQEVTFEMVWTNEGPRARALWRA